MAMKCPVCDPNSPAEKVTVSASKPDPELPQTRRRLLCTNGHRFPTVERPEALSLDNLGIRRTGDEKVRRFNQDKLLDQLRSGVNGTLTEAEIFHIRNGVLEQLTYKLPSLVEWAMPQPTKSTNTGQQFTPAVEAVAVLRDTELRDMVEHHLKRGAHNRIAHVLYAIAVHGRTDRPPRRGWKNGATDVLDWLHDEYPDLDAPRPEPPAAPRAEHTWLPTAPEFMPSHVLKADRVIISPALNNEDPHDIQIKAGRLVDFQLNRLIQAIQHAMFGHRHREQWSRWIAWWVLRGLEGQDRITSAQLSVGVLDTLRMVDDLAYLRWATRHKNIPQVSGIRQEAAALITHPSDRLHFSEHQPAPRRHYRQSSGSNT